MTGKVTVRQTTFQPGTTKIAVPITGRTSEEIIIQAKNAIAHHPDVIEWRIDYYQDVLNTDAYQTTYNQLREILADTVLLTTFRTTGEGGEAALSEAGYTSLYERLIENQLTDMLDFELHFSDAAISKLISRAHQYDLKVVLSAHNFQATPTEVEIAHLLNRMENQNADIAKVAAMPTKFKDVLTIMRATATESEKMTIPIIAISMGDLGKISRITAPLFGSVMSFATVGGASAPGQIGIDDLRKEMKTFETK